MSKQNQNICCICYEEKDSPFITKWTCVHEDKFHKCCIEKWNNGCPICRNQECLDEYKRKDNTFTDEQILSFETHNRRVQKRFHNIYLQHWKNSNCIEENHEFIIVQPYGVMVICKKCNTYQCHNLRHNVNLQNLIETY